MQALVDALFRGDSLWFSIPALAGSLFFVVRLLLMVVGGGGDFDGAHADVADMHGGDAAHHFQVFSIQSILAFMMGFGWSGLAALKGSGMSVVWSVLIGLAAGIALVVIMAWLLSSVQRLAASGNLPLETLKDRFGEVVIGVPAAGAGRGEVKVVINDRERRCGAVSEGGAIAARSRIRVVSVNEDNTVTVRPA